VSGDIWGYLGCNLCQKRLRLRLKVDECEPLPGRRGSGPPGGSARAARTSRRPSGRAHAASCTGTHVSSHTWQNHIEHHRVTLDVFALNSV